MCDTGRRRSRVEIESFCYRCSLVIVTPRVKRFGSLENCFRGNYAEDGVRETMEIDRQGGYEALQTVEYPIRCEVGGQERRSVGAAIRPQ